MRNVMHGGVAVNPTTVRFTAAQHGADPGAVAAIKARLKSLLREGTKKPG